VSNLPDNWWAEEELTLPNGVKYKLEYKGRPTLWDLVNIAALHRPLKDEFQGAQDPLALVQIAKQYGVGQNQRAINRWLGLGDAVEMNIDAVLNKLIECLPGRPGRNCSG
jgi:hypothetical protein